MKTSSPNGRTSTRTSRISAPVIAEGVSDFVEDSGRTTEPTLSVRQRIAERAYLLYLARGGENGDALADWLEAERQITQEAAALLG